LIIEGKAKKPFTCGSTTTRSKSGTLAKIWGKEVPDHDDMVRAETDEDAKVAASAGRRKAGFICLHMNICTGLPDAVGREL